MQAGNLTAVTDLGHSIKIVCFFSLVVQVILPYDYCFCATIIRKLQDLTFYYLKFAFYVQIHKLRRAPIT